MARTPRTPHITRTITDALADAAAEYVPAIVANGFRKAAQNTEDATAAAILEVMASYVEREGREHVEALGYDISKFIQGKAQIDLLNQHLNAAELTRLVDGFQSAEAKHRASYAALAEGMGSLAARLGLIAVNAAAGRLLGDLK